MVVSRGNGKETVISRRDLVHVDQGVTVTSYRRNPKARTKCCALRPSGHSARSIENNFT